jgi:hypothetical protein
MGEHMFGLGNGELTEEAVAAIDEIAGAHECKIVPYEEQGRHRYWFAGPNLGFPFDRAMERAVWGDLEKAGLANAKGLVESCFVGAQGAV